MNGPQAFGVERFIRALLDRLTHHVPILEMNGDSYRLQNSWPTPPCGGYPRLCWLPRRHAMSTRRSCSTPVTSNSESTAWLLAGLR